MYMLPIAECFSRMWKRANADVYIQWARAKGGEDESHGRSTNETNNTCKHTMGLLIVDRFIIEQDPQRTGD